MGLAAASDTARTLYERFAADLAGLSALERAGVARGDLRPLGPAVVGAGALAVLAGLGKTSGRPTHPARWARPLLAVLLSAHAALGLVVLGLAVWLAAKGSVGGPDELGFRFTDGERAVTLTTQVLAWAPLVALFGLLALKATEPGRPEPDPAPPLVSDEMDALWRERLAFGPKRERARNLLGRIRDLEQAGEHESARALAEEMRRL